MEHEQRYKMLDDTDPAIVGVELVEEHEDGSATYNIHMNDTSRYELAKIGLDFVFVCAAYAIDLNSALEYLSTYKKETMEHEGSSI
jgi:hypothetical protein